MAASTQSAARTRVRHVSTRAADFNSSAHIRVKQLAALEQNQSPNTHTLEMEGTLKGRLLQLPCSAPRRERQSRFVLLFVRTAGRRGSYNGDKGFKRLFLWRLREGSLTPRAAAHAGWSSGLPFVIVCRSDNKNSENPRRGLCCIDCTGRDRLRGCALIALLWNGFCLSRYPYSTAHAFLKLC